MVKFDFLLMKNLSLTITLKSGAKFKLEKDYYALLDNNGNNVDFPDPNAVGANINNASYIKIITSSTEHTISIDDIEIMEPSKSATG